jgi:hypothetical protein
LIARMTSIRDDRDVNLVVTVQPVSV